MKKGAKHMMKGKGYEKDGEEKAGGKKGFMPFKKKGAKKGSKK
jgi:hypothetical protein